MIDPITAISDPDACGERIVIVDETGPYLPFGLAEQFALADRTVTIVTPHMAIGTRLGVTGTAELGWAYPRIIDAGVQVRPYSYLESVGGDRVSIVSTWGAPRETIGADTVILAMHRTADAALFLELSEDDRGARRIGDCVAPRELDHAVFEGVREGHAI